MKIVRLISDGACIGNPGPGGWACLLRYGSHLRELFGSSPHTTNNRMELAGAIEGLRALKEPCQVELVTDSQYLKNGITRWIRAWKRNQWKTAGKQPVKNRELWQALEQAAAPHQVSWVWVRGHSSHADNLRADELAVRAAAEQSFSKGWHRAVESPKYDLPRKRTLREPD